jgi:hypothetical protein
VRTTKAGQSALLFLDIVQVLNRERIDYLVIGAFALSAHGVIRGSRDVDALVHVSTARFATLKVIFEEAGLETTLRQGDADDPIPRMLILRDAHANQVNLLGGLRGLDPAAFSCALVLPFFGEELRIVGREDFIAMKCFAGAPQDLLDARAAYAEAPGPVDSDLLRRLTRRFGRDAADRLAAIL